MKTFRLLSIFSFFIASFFSSTTFGKSVTLPYAIHSIANKNCSLEAYLAQKKKRSKNVRKELKDNQHYFFSTFANFLFFIQKNLLDQDPQAHLLCSTPTFSSMKSLPQSTLKEVANNLFNELITDIHSTRLLYKLAQGTLTTKYIDANQVCLDSPELCSDHTKDPEIPDPIPTDIDYQNPPKRCTTNTECIDRLLAMSPQEIFSPAMIDTFRRFFKKSETLFCQNHFSNSPLEKSCYKLTTKSRVQLNEVSHIIEQHTAFSSCPFKAIESSCSKLFKKNSSSLSLRQQAGHQKSLYKIALLCQQRSPKMSSRKGRCLYPSSWPQREVKQHFCSLPFDKRIAAFHDLQKFFAKSTDKSFLCKLQSMKHYSKIGVPYSLYLKQLKSGAKPLPDDCETKLDHAPFLQPQTVFSCRSFSKTCTEYYPSLERELSRNKIAQKDFLLLKELQEQTILLLKKRNQLKKLTRLRNRTEEETLRLSLLWLEMRTLFSAMERSHPFWQDTKKYPLISHHFNTHFEINCAYFKEATTLVDLSLVEREKKIKWSPVVLTAHSCR